MEFIQVQSSAAIQIQSYRPGELKINHVLYHHSLIALPERLIEDWPVANVEALTPETGELFVALKPEVLLIGTGEKLIFPNPELLAWFRAQNFGVEFMDTFAACRTFQILTSENRKVVAALIV